MSPQVRVFYLQECQGAVLYLPLKHAASNPASVPFIPPTQQQVTMLFLQKESIETGTNRTHETLNLIPLLGISQTFLHRDKRCSTLRKGFIKYFVIIMLLLKRPVSEKKWISTVTADGLVVPVIYRCYLYCLAIGLVLPLISFTPPATLTCPRSKTKN